MGDHSGFDLQEGTVIREVDSAFGNGAASSSLTVVTRHTKSFHAPIGNDWWEFVIWGNVGATPVSTKSVLINFDSTLSIDVNMASDVEGAYVIKAHVQRYGAGVCSYYYTLDVATGTQQRVQATGAAFPTAAGNITIQTQVDNASDSISCRGVIIKTGGNG